MLIFFNFFLKNLFYFIYHLKSTYGARLRTLLFVLFQYGTIFYFIFILFVYFDFLFQQAENFFVVLSSPVAFRAVLIKHIERYPYEYKLRMSIEGTAIVFKTNFKKLPPHVSFMECLVYYPDTYKLVTYKFK